MKQLDIATSSLSSGTEPTVSTTPSSSSSATDALNGELTSLHGAYGLCSDVLILGNLDKINYLTIITEECSNSLLNLFW